MASSLIGFCGRCEERVPVERVVHDGKVYLRKSCPSCGPSETLISSDADEWRLKREIWQEECDDVEACSFNCPRCGESHQPRIVFIDVTNRCNMNCPICIANIRGMGFTFEPPLAYFETIFKELQKFSPTPIVELFGGEPTVRKDLLDIIKTGRRYGIKCRVVTNGLRLADEEYCRTLCGEGVRFRIALDGRAPEIYQRLRRNGSACEKKLQGLANLKKYSRRKHAIMSCIACGINEDAVADLIQCCHEHAGLIDTIGLIPLTENWEPGTFEADQHTTREDVERLVKAAIPGDEVDFVPAGIVHYLTPARMFFRERSHSDVLMLGGVHPDCESMTVLVSDGQRYRSANWYFRLPLRTVAGEVFQTSRRITPKLERLDRRKWFDRWRGRLLVLRAFLPIFLRAVRVRPLFRGNPLASVVRIVVGLLRGQRFRDLAYRHMNPPRFLRVVVFPFEEKHSLDSARVRKCTAAFAYVDPADGKVKTISACAWNTYRNELLRPVAEKYAAAEAAV